ncbi:MAG: TetR/AcrR family transcriptional regulator [Chloroflexi bacterium]|nr:TetR/AcrR family transcriptional regulator [Chloroflexota bacterium]OJW02813.1 MAG: hypothetical protein BGO39_06200 [Chloroflexi bacterium 54-19]
MNLTGKDLTGISRAEKKKTQIREAARVLFLENGFMATSTDAIMAAAGIASKETLYRYYPSKEELFEDVLRSLTLEGPHFQGLFGQTAPPSNSQELEALLEKVVREILTTMLQPDYLAVIRIIVAESPRFPRLGPLFRKTVPEQALNYLQTLLAEGQTGGLVKKDLDLEVTGRMLLGTLLTYALFDGLFLGNNFPQMPSSEVINSIVTNFRQIITPEIFKIGDLQ